MKKILDILAQVGLFVLVVFVVPINVLRHIFTDYK